MGATSPASTHPSGKSPRDPATSTADLDPTTDVHEESTSDLDSTTADAAPPESVSSQSVSTQAVFDTRDDPGAAVREQTQEMQAPARSEAGAPSLAPGAILNDRYLLEEVLGAGGRCDRLSSARHALEPRRCAQRAGRLEDASP